ncbi:hypothetical protein [Paenibacillus phocaensis]|uniref:hypothetical protein n=1 Tax=Paenibacillus phocaensis TaxID=1776378 RepID=UPI000839D146|nr:hypothetical protein [Paenibacillus phocaensis]
MLYKMQHFARKAAYSPRKVAVFTTFLTEERMVEQMEEQAEEQPEEKTVERPEERPEKQARN